MLLKLDNPKIFSEIISIISELVLEVRIKVNREGMSIQAIDPANVAMISFKLPSSAFSELEIENEEVLGVSLDSLKAVLRRVKAGSVLIITKQENELRLQIQDKVKREFNLALIDIETEEKELPNLDFSSKIEMPSLDFAEAIEDCGVVADSCSFVSEPDKFVMKAKGSLNSFKSEFSSDELNIEAENNSSKYSLEYLQKMVKATKITDKVKVNFATDYPLRLEFITPFIELAFILAPRVESED
ncbi:proliferating cell nuclear antigen (pcna) [archaeon]|jgi:proliferating cell nuclear antigen|nr:proliferating cell nuclear antigen (pcna) [archaeon]MBT4242211.1 proliferating cell nuclear antigen (pcna) [archaeon]MBT4417899.1 proliferating cell nuclear antigen (pcna) [archaeon]